MSSLQVDPYVTSSVGDNQGQHKLMCVIIILVKPLQYPICHLINVALEH